MKRFGVLLAVAFLASVFAGCDSGGLQEGAPQEAPKSSQTDQFKAEMQRNAEKMKMKKANRKPAETPDAGKTAP